MGRSIASRGEPKVSKGRAESPLVRPQAQTPAPVGIDAPTPARVDGAAAPTGDSTFFRRERKYQRKHAARRLREKALYCPFWRRGSLCRAQRSWPAYACYRARSELAFFRRQNGRAFFPPLPIAALLPRSWRGAYLPLAGWDASVQLGDFAREKVSAKPNSRWPFLRAMRPVAEWRYELANWQGAAPDPRAVAPVVPRR